MCHPIRGLGPRVGEPALMVGCGDWPCVSVRLGVARSGSRTIPFNASLVADVPRSRYGLPIVFESLLVRSLPLWLECSAWMVAAWWLMFLVRGTVSDRVREPVSPLTSALAGVFGLDWWQPYEWRRRRWCGSFLDDGDASPVSALYGGLPRGIVSRAGYLAFRLSNRPRGLAQCIMSLATLINVRP